MAVLKNIVSKIFNLSTTPAKKTEGQFWYDTTNNVLKRSDGTDYKPLAVGDNLISAGSTDTVKGILDSKANASDLTNYLPLTGGTIARAEENPDNPILTIQDTQYGFGWPMAGLLVKGGMYNDFIEDYDYYSTYIRPNEITGDAVTSSITSGSRKLLTSGGAYTALQNKANTSDLNKYLLKTGGIIQNNSLEEFYDQQTTTTLNGNYIEIANRSSEQVCTKISESSIEISYDAPGGRATTNIDSQMISTGNSIGSSVLLNSSISSSTLSSDFSQYAVNIGTLGAGASYGTPQETEDFYGLNIGHCDTGEFDISNVNTFSSTIFKAGYTLNEDLEYIPEISGSLIDKTISSHSLDTHIPTSKAVYIELQSKADNTNVVHLSGDEVITGNKTFTSSIRFSSDDTFNTNLAGVSVPDPVTNPGPPILIIDSNSNITIDASNVMDTDLYYSCGIISGVNTRDRETFRIDGKNGSASFSSLSTYSISGSAVVSTLGTSTTSSKLPTEGAVVKAISDVKTSLGSALTYEGSVENYANLPTGLTTSDKGKVYNVVNANGNIPAGTNYAWNGTSWDALGGDMSAYLRKEGDTSLTLGDKEYHTSGKLVVSDFICSGTTITSDNVKIGNETSQIVLDAVDGIELQDNDGNNTLNLKHDGISGSLVDTTIQETPVAGHIATTGAIKTYVDNSTSNKVEKNSDANLTSIVMPTFSSSTGVQNGSAKLKLYKDDTTGAITIEIEEVE